jgi:predicted S18 family serine protease
MKKIKHSKFKNTAMLFELLTRQITSDIISSNESVAIQILKKHFNKNTELIKEYRLYKTLCDERLKSDTKANMLIEAALKARRGLNRNKLQTEKYQLIKSIKENFDINSFFQTKVQNYKLLASIYKIFEYNEIENPIELTKSRITILENITSKTKNSVITEDVAIANEPKEVRLMAYKYLVEKFNAKYNNLSESQKVLLREYIENVSNTNNLKSLVQTEAVTIKRLFTKNMHRVKDKSLKIKLQEVVGLLDEYVGIKKVEENHISALLRYYSLIDDLSWSK